MRPAAARDPGGRLLRHHLPRDLPPEARTYALPKEWNERWGLRRYGFHGLATRTPYVEQPRSSAVLAGPARRVVPSRRGRIAGGGARRASVDTTMGFTPLDGLVMATRSGSLDPGLLLWLLRARLGSRCQLADVLEHEVGLKGLSGTSGDLRDVLAGRAAGDEDAPSPSTCSSTGFGGRSGRWRRAQGDSTCWS